MTSQTTPQLKVSVICEDCSSGDDENKSLVDMEPEGPLAINREHMIRTQVYVCPMCSHSISVSLQQLS